jgi:tight adherence protein C
MDIFNSGTASMHHLLLGVVFTATALTVAAAGVWLLTLTNPLRRRLAQVSSASSPSAPTATQDEHFKVKFIDPLATALLPEDDWRRSHLRTRLVRAGLRDPDDLQLYLVVKPALGLGLPLLTGLALLLGGIFTEYPGIVALVLGGVALLGFMLPNIYLMHRIEDRQQRIGESFPDGLDMLVVCVEAGLSLDAAIQRVGREMEHSHPELAEELGLVSLELRAGRDRDDAFQSLADRAGVEDIRSFISILLQAQHFGTGVASALREQAADLRQIRMQRAREKAGKLPVKLIFPIMVFIFPAMFLVILGPAFIRIYTAIITQGH